MIKKSENKTIYQTHNAGVNVFQVEILEKLVKIKKIDESTRKVINGTYLVYYPKKIFIGKSPRNKSNSVLFRHARILEILKTTKTVSIIFWYQ